MSELDNELSGFISNVVQNPKIGLGFIKWFMWQPGEWPEDKSGSQVLSDALQITPVPKDVMDAFKADVNLTTREQLVGTRVSFRREIAEQGRVPDQMVGQLVAAALRPTPWEPVEVSVMHAGIDGTDQVCKVVVESLDIKMTDLCELISSKGGDQVRTLTIGGVQMCRPPGMQTQSDPLVCDFDSFLSSPDPVMYATYHTDKRESSYRLRSISKKQFADAFTQNSKVSALQISGHELGAEGCECLAVAMEGNSSLQTLNLTNRESYEERGIGPRGAASLAAVVSGNNALTMLDLSGNQIGKHGAAQLAVALGSNTSLQGVALEECDLHDVAVEQLASAFQKHCAINAVSLNHNQEIGERGYEQIAACLKHNASITSLEVAGIGIDKQKAELLAEGLQSNRTLTTLNLAYTGIGADGAKRVLSALQEHPALSKLDLSGNCLQEEAEWIGVMLEASASLATLNLESAQISAAGVGRICDALATNRTVKHISLTSNEIGNQGAEHIARALVANQCLEKLELSDCDIEFSGVEQIIASLMTNSSLSSLDLNSANCCFEEDAVLENTIFALQQNCGLTELQLGHVSLGDNGAVWLGTALEKNAALKKVLLCGNKIGSKGASKLALALESNNTLQELIMCHNQAGELGAEAFASALPKNAELLTLNLCCNAIGISGMLKMIDALKANNTLTDIDVTDYDPEGEPSSLSTNFEIILELFMTNEHLCHFSLGESDICDSHVEALTKALEKNKTLRNLNLYGNHDITDAGARCIVNLLERNTTLTGIELDAVNAFQSKISEHVRDDIKYLLERNQRIQKAGLLILNLELSSQKSGKVFILARNLSGAEAISLEVDTSCCTSELIDVFVSKSEHQGSLQLVLPNGKSLDDFEQSLRVADLLS